MKIIDKVKKKKPKLPIRILRTVKEKMAVMGIIVNQQTNNLWQINRKQRILLICCFIILNLFIAFALDEANDTEEYLITVFLITSVVITVIGFISIIYRKDKVFNVIENYEKEIETSKWEGLVQGVKRPSTVTKFDTSLYSNVARFDRICHCDHSK